MIRDSEKWLAVATAGRWQIPAIVAAKKLGIKTIAIDGNSLAEGLALADRAFVMDINDPVSVIKKLENEEINLVGAVSYCSESGMFLAASIREAFDLPGPNCRLTESLTNKYIQRVKWKASHVPSPQWWLCESEREVRTVLKNQTLPLIIKPIDSAGSRGVAKIETLDRNISGIIDQAFNHSKTSKVLVETFMAGTEYTVETFGANGDIHVLAITEKKKVEGTNGVVAKELFTPEMSIFDQNELQKAVVGALKALEYFDGPGHSEIIMMENGKVGLVEAAGRGGGFKLFESFLPAVSGIDVTRLTIMQLIGQPVERISLNPNKGVLRFIPSRPGTVKSIDGIQRANKLKNVDAGSFVKVGDRVGGASSDGDRLGYILTTDESIEKAQALANSAEDKIQFTIGA